MDGIPQEIDSNSGLAAPPQGILARAGTSFRTLIAISGFDLFVLVFMAILLSILVKTLGHQIRWLHPSMGLPLAILGSVLLIETLRWGYFGLKHQGGKAHNFLAQIPFILRDWTPFILVDFIYENLHDISGKLTSFDIAGVLYQIDLFIFGVEPTVWAQNITHPILTDIMAILYAPYLAYPLILMAILSLMDRREDFQKISIAVILTFLIGFILYAVFPCNPPRFYLEGMFTDPVDLRGSFIHYHLQGVWDDNTVVRGAAFPSLHTGISSVALFFAFKLRNISKLFKGIFIVYLPLIVGLWMATVYLRHHWVPDIVAGWAVASLAIFISGKLLKKQNQWHQDLGLKFLKEKPSLKTILQEASIDSQPDPS